MKLAEALILRSDYQKKIYQLKERLSNNVKVQEGEIPSEEPNNIFLEIQQVTRDLTYLIKRINKTNSNVKFDEKRTIADILVERDSISNVRKIISEILQDASFKQDRFTRSEVKYLTTIDVKEYQEKLDSLSKEFRELDTKIQQMNWTVELV